MHDDELRTRLRAPLDRVSGASEDLGPVVRRARRLRARRYAAVALSALVLAAGIAVPLWSLSSVHGDANHVLGSQQDYGLRLDVPPSWDETLSYRSTDLGPVLWVSSKTLPDHPPLPYLL